MSQDEKKLRAEALSAFKKLRAQSRSLVLATTDAGGLPSVSYAPFVYDDEGSFLVFVSGLSAHTGHLLSTAVAAVLLIEDESATKQIFARKRISYRCDITLVDGNESYYQSMLDRMASRFGNVVDILRALPDFRMFRLSPVSGRFVTGFGQAYDLAGRDLSQLVHVGEAQINKA